MLLDFTGGSLSILQMFLLSYNYGRPIVDIIVYNSPPTTMVGLNDIVGNLTMAIIAFYLYKYGRPEL